MSEILRELYATGDFPGMDQATLGPQTTSASLIWAARGRLEQGELKAALSLMDRAAKSAQGTESLRIEIQRLGLRAQTSGRVTEALEAADLLLEGDKPEDPILKAYRLRLDLLAEMLGRVAPGRSRDHLSVLVTELADVSPETGAIAARWLAIAAPNQDTAAVWAARSSVLAGVAGLDHIGAEAWIAAAAAARKAYDSARHRIALTKAHAAFKRAAYLPGPLTEELERARFGLLEGTHGLGDLEALLGECARMRG